VSDQCFSPTVLYTTVCNLLSRCIYFLRHIKVDWLIEYAFVQVSVTAEQKCRLLTWSSSHLRQYLTSDSHLLIVFDLIIGNDIASKLYSAKCRQHHAAAASFVSVPANRSLPLQLNVEDSRRSVQAVRGRPDRPEQLPLKSRLPSFSGESLSK